MNHNFGIFPGIGIGLPHLIRMLRLRNLSPSLAHAARTLLSSARALGLALVLLLRSRSALAAEIVFLRRQLALFVERDQSPRRADDGTRLTLVLLARLFDWRSALVFVRPETLIRWHRHIARLLWRVRSRRPGRPPIPHDLRRLVTEMNRDNPTWGQQRIADELKLKLGLRLSPRTVAKYLPKPPAGPYTGSCQRWSTFLRNHAREIVATDFLTVVTARFEVLYVLVFLELGSRRILHWNVTANPHQEWTVQQLRETFPGDHPYRFFLHDRDDKFSLRVDGAARSMDLRVLRTPARAPLANAFCERVIGTLRRECLDHMIPLSDVHLRRLLREYVDHYNRARPHQSLGPGLPNPPEGLPVKPQPHRHQLPPGARIASRPVLGGLHHEYGLEQAVA